MRTDLCAELPKIMVDRVQLQQVFMNLMLNAIEAMARTQAEKLGGEVAAPGFSTAILGQSDTGAGLPTDTGDQIFSAFFTTKTQGSGMGLAISRFPLWSRTEAGCGRPPNVDEGATFHFTLPIRVTQSSPLVA